MLQPTSIFSSIIEIYIFFFYLEEEIAFLYFFTLYLEIVILEEYIGAYLISIIEFLYFRGEIAKYIGDGISD